MNKTSDNENNMTNLSSSANAYESEPTDDTSLNENYYFVETEDEEIARCEKIIRELTEFEESQKFIEN